MSRGEFVYTLNNKRYFLTYSQAQVVDEASDNEPDDAKFNAWFADYAKENNIRSEEKKHAQYWSRIPDSVNSVEKLALVQNAMTTLIRVVNPRIRKNQVEFRDDATTSAWNHKDDKVILPPGPAIASKTLYEAIDNTAGYAVHESFHSKFSGPHMPRLDYYIRQSKKFAEVWNAVEDLRVNYWGLEENPGFTDYIRNTYNNIVDEANYTLPAKWPTEFPQQLAALISPFTYGIDRVGDPKDTDYYDKYLEAKKVLDPWETASTESLTTAKIVDTVNTISALLDDPKPSDKKSPVPTAMCDSEGDKKLSEQEKQMVDALVQSELKEIEEKEFPIEKIEGNDPPKSRVMKPNFIPRSKIQVSSGIQKADAQLRLKKTRPRNDERHMKSGELDEDELYRLLQGDTRVFRDITEEVEESASVHFLIDASGSMSGTLGGGWADGGRGSKIAVAAELAYLMVHSMNKRPHVKVHVWAHTGDTYLAGMQTTDSVGGMVIYKIWEPGDDLIRLNMINEVPRGNNYDSYAIGYVGRQLMKEEADKKYLIVLSDGQPAGSFYGGQPAIDHVRQNTDFLIRKGISVIQVAIGRGIYASQQAEMFKHFVTYTNISNTIKALAKVLDKVR